MTHFEAVQAADWLRAVCRATPYPVCWTEGLGGKCWFEPPRVQAPAIAPVLHSPPGEHRLRGSSTGGVSETLQLSVMIITGGIPAMMISPQWPTILFLDSCSAHDKAGRRSEFSAIVTCACASTNAQNRVAREPEMHCPPPSVLAEMRCPGATCPCAWPLLEAVRCGGGVHHLPLVSLQSPEQMTGSATGPPRSTKLPVS